MIKPSDSVVPKSPWPCSSSQPPTPATMAMETKPSASRVGASALVNATARMLASREAAFDWSKSAMFSASRPNACVSLTAAMRSSRFALHIAGACSHQAKGLAGLAGKPRRGNGHERHHGETEQRIGQLRASMLPVTHTMSSEPWMTEMSGKPMACWIVSAPS